MNPEDEIAESETSISQYVVGFRVQGLGCRGGGGLLLAILV